MKKLRKKLNLNQDCNIILMFGGGNENCRNGSEDIVLDESIIAECMEESGILFYPEHGDSPLDMDSITFISTIVALENRFQIEISDQFLGYKPGTYNEFMKFAHDAISEAMKSGRDSA